MQRPLPSLKMTCKGPRDAHCWTSTGLLDATRRGPNSRRAPVPAAMTGLHFRSSSSSDWSRQPAEKRRRGKQHRMQYSTETQMAKERVKHVRWDKYMLHDSLDVNIKLSFIVDKKRETTKFHNNNTANCYKNWTFIIFRSFKWVSRRLWVTIIHPASIWRIFSGSDLDFSLLLLFYLSSSNSSNFPLVVRISCHWFVQFVYLILF